MNPSELQNIPIIPDETPATAAVYSLRAELFQLFDAALATCAHVTLYGPDVPQAAECLRLWAEPLCIEIKEQTIDPVKSNPLVYSTRPYVSLRVKTGNHSDIVVIAARFVEAK